MNNFNKIVELLDIFNSSTCAKLRTIAKISPRVSVNKFNKLSSWISLRLQRLTVFYNLISRINIIIIHFIFDIFLFLMSLFLIQLYNFLLKKKNYII